MSAYLWICACTHQLLTHVPVWWEGVVQTMLQASQSGLTLHSRESPNTTQSFIVTLLVHTHTQAHTWSRPHYTHWSPPPCCWSPTLHEHSSLLHHCTHTRPLSRWGTTPTCRVSSSYTCTHTGTRVYTNMMRLVAARSLRRCRSSSGSSQQPRVLLVSPPDQRSNLVLLKWPAPQSAHVSCTLSCTLRHTVGYCMYNSTCKKLT